MTCKLNRSSFNCNRSRYRATHFKEIFKRQSWSECACARDGRWLCEAMYSPSGQVGWFRTCGVMLRVKGRWNPHKSLTFRLCRCKRFIRSIACRQILLHLYATPLQRPCAQPPIAFLVISIRFEFFVTRPVPPRTHVNIMMMSNHAICWCACCTYCLLWESHSFSPCLHR